MEKLIRFIKIDIVVQKILLFVVCITGVFLMPMMITLPLLGGWQLLSAFIIWWRLKDKIRKKYLLFSIVYIGLMFLSTYSLDFTRSGFQEILVPLIFVPIPIGIAMWYFVVTKNTLKDLQNLEIVEVTEAMENILDSEEIFKPSEKL